MSAEPPDWIRNSLSLPRFTPYVTAARESVDVAIRLYWWNIEISAAFYGLLHCLELSLRNALHDQLSGRYGRADWWEVAPLSDEGTRKVTDAQRKLRRSGNRRPAACDTVAELSFGFWVSLLSRGRAYDRTLWVPTLHRAFPYYSGPRGALHDNLVAMLLLRNRIMHHEPIHHRDLAADRRKIYRLLGYLSPGMAKELQSLDRVPEVLVRRQGVLDGEHLPHF